MKLNITYRPFTATLTVWDILNDVLPEETLAGIQRRYDDEDEEKYHIAIGTLDGEFHELMVVDCFGGGQGWNLWLTGLLPDETINTLVNLVAGWDAEHDKDDDVRTRMVICHRAQVEV